MLICNFDANALRSMYVDDFSSILGDFAEDNLLSYAPSNGIETLLLEQMEYNDDPYQLWNQIK